MLKPYFEQDGIRIFHGDSRELLDEFDLRSSIVLTGPPYYEMPDVAKDVVSRIDAAHFFCQWFEKQMPPSKMFHATTYYWAHSDSSREQWFYHFNADGRFYPHDLFNHPSVSPQSEEYVGCPWQFPVALAEWLLKKVKPCPVFDPFCGSGTTLLAAKHLGDAATGIEINERFCEMAAKRLRDAH